MRLQEIILEKKKEPKRAQVYPVDLDVKYAFPDNVISALQKEIRKGARDLKQKWTPILLTNDAFTQVKVPIPQAFMHRRWYQYCELLKSAVDALTAARGAQGDWI